MGQSGADFKPDTITFISMAVFCFFQIPMSTSSYWDGCHAEPHRTTNQDLVPEPTQSGVMIKMEEPQSSSTSIDGLSDMGNGGVGSSDQMDNSAGSTGSSLVSSSSMAGLQACQRVGSSGAGSIQSLPPSMGSQQMQMKNPMHQQHMSMDPSMTSLTATNHHSLHQQATPNTATSTSESPSSHTPSSVTPTGALHLNNSSGNMLHGASNHASSNNALQSPPLGQSPPNFNHHRQSPSSTSSPMMRMGLGGGDGTSGPQGPQGPPHHYPGQGMMMSLPGNMGGPQPQQHGGMMDAAAHHYTQGEYASNTINNWHITPTEYSEISHKLDELA